LTVTNDNDSPKEKGSGGDGPGGANPGTDSGNGHADAGANAAAEAAAAEGPEVELARTKERLLRMAADFDNYRKRSRRDIADAERRVQEGLLTALLPTFDNLERAARHAESAPDIKSLAEGLEMVMRQFQDTLKDLGIERVASVGRPFDPAEHEAVQHVHSDEVPPGAVVQELRGGYRWQGKLMRPALVVVSKAPAPAAASPEGA
jgi:molecular chaperone GrpE